MEALPADEENMTKLHMRPKLNSLAEMSRPMVKLNTAAETPHTHWRGDELRLV